MFWKGLLKKVYKECTSHINFTHDTLISKEIKLGKRKILTTALQTTISEIKNIFYSNYNLEEAIVVRLELFFF